MAGLIWLALVGCGAPSDGTVEVAAWGEDEVTEGFGADETDGWDLSFDHWYVGLGDVTLSSVDTDDVVVTGGSAVLDLVGLDGPSSIATLTAPGERHRFGFSTRVPEGADIVDESDVADLMAADGAVHWLQGSATDGTTTVTFDWTFGDEVDYTGCENGDDASDGIAVSSDETVSAEITLHTDHLLWTQLGTEQAALGFAALAAADADEDGEVTVAELQAVDPIDVGYETSGISLDSLHAFLGYSITQMAHLNGDGLCTARRRE